MADSLNKCSKMSALLQPQDEYLRLVAHSHSLITQIMTKYSIEEFNPVGQPYDPSFQESLLQIATPPGGKSGTVAETLRTGYKIQGRLLRPARVVVYS